MNTLPCDGSPFPVCFSLSTVRAHRRERAGGRAEAGEASARFWLPIERPFGGGRGVMQLQSSSAPRSMHRSLWWLLHLTGVIVWPRSVCLISALPLPGRGRAVLPERGDWKARQKASEAGRLLSARERQALQYLSALRRSLDGFSTLFWPVGDLHSQL